MSPGQRLLHVQVEALDVGVLEVRIHVGERNAGSLGVGVKRRDGNRCAVVGDRGAEWWIGSQPGHNAGNGLVHQIAVASAHNGLARPAHVPRKTDTRLDVVVLAIRGVLREAVGSHLRQASR